MPKARPHPGQLDFDFRAPAPARGVAALAGLERRICETVGTLIATDGRPREIIAAEMSVLLDDEVSRDMLNAYSSPAREGHRVPMSRFFALLVVTGRQDLLDPLVREIGAALLVGDEVKTARLGQIERLLAELQDERRALKGAAPKIREQNREAGR